MLILLTGSEAIGKKHLARFIVNQLNTFTYGDRNINFKQGGDGNVIMEVDGVVLGAELEDETLSDCIDWADKLYNEVMHRYATLCHKFDVHSDPYFDIGVNKDHIPFDGNTLLLHSPDVLETYRNKSEVLDTVVYT